MKIEGQHYKLKIYYPYNSMRYKDALQGLLDNLDKINISEIENLVKK